jgi:uncharacterized protein
MPISATISPDNMEAIMEVERNSEHPLDVETIKRLLQEAGVRYGIDEEACVYLAEAVKNIPVGERITHPVAHGTPPIDGENGRLEMVVEYHRNQVGLELDFGKIDFHQRGAFTGVEKGQLIANIVLPTPGTPGKNVCGEELKPQPGKPADFRAGQGTKIEPNRTELRATRAGDLRCAGELIEVMDMIRIAGNVDFAVGNIECEGPVRIQGDVLPGFHIHAVGDVVISGVVDSAEVNSQGSVIVSQGVIRGSRIYAKKGIMVGYVRESYLESESTIKIVNEAVNSTVVSADTIGVATNGRVVGGRLLARNHIEVGTAGLPKGVLTVLAAGVNPFDEYQAARLQASIKWTEKREALVDRMKDLAHPEHHPVLEQMVSQQTTRREQHMEELAELQQNAVEHIDSRVKANVAIHPGVVIRIGPAELPIKTEQPGNAYHYDSGSGEIVTVNPKAKI